MQQGMQTDATWNIINVGSCWPTMLRPFVQGLTFTEKIRNRYPFFNDSDNSENTLFIINNVNPYIYRLTAAYIHSCMTYRQKLFLFKIIPFILI